MNNKRLVKLIKKLNTIKESGKTIGEYYGKKSFNQTYFRAVRSEINRDSKELDPELVKEFFDLFQSIEPVRAYNGGYKKLDSIDRTEIGVRRNEEGKITEYHFTIYIKNKADLVGSLTRTEMNSVYRLYSYYGANITQREVSRQLPEYSLMDFKRILRAFNITKAAGPFAPHMYEEHTEEELQTIHADLKERDFVNKLEKDELETLKKQNLKLAKANKVFNDRLEAIKSVDLAIKESNFNPKKFIANPNNKNNDLIIWLSDMHFGAYNDDFGFYPIEEYNETQIMKRLDIIIARFAGKQYRNIYVVNLGDSIDSYNKKTTRGGHDLPSVMTDKEMSEMYVRCMLQFFTNLQSNVKHDMITYLCVGESNHDGVAGWLNNKIVEAYIHNMGIKTYVSQYPIDSFVVGPHTFVYMHGKDDHNQFKNFPLTLNDKAELYLTKYIYDNNITGKYKYVVKGDLHRFAYTSSQIFDYISVGSLYGSSNWITANFGNTAWSINYMELNGDDMHIGTIKE